ncbi:MAG: sugar ABC transporter permease [Anaerolineales bacterium]|nr:MAG: sugar ABC transporter permease [Anaerolineales bacterium]
MAVRGRIRRITGSVTFSAYWMIAPAVLLVAAFTLYPYIYALWSSIRVVSPLLPPAFAGLKNYKAVITNKYFLRAVKRTLIFTFASVPITVLLGLLTAALLNRRFFGDVALKALVLLPWAIPISISGVVWRGFFNSGWGALNALLYMTGIIPKYIGWLTTPSLATLVVITVQVWTQFPFATVLILAAMQAIPEELYEAAAIDGAGLLQRFFYVTLPSIRAMLAIVVIFEALVGLTTFDLTYALTGGGPGTATTFISYFTWAESFKMLNFGNGAALAVILAVVSLAMIFAILQFIPRGALVGGEER